MGRHSSVKSRGWRSRSPVIALSAALVLALVGWFTYDFLADRLRASELRHHDGAQRDRVAGPRAGGRQHRA